MELEDLRREQFRLRRGTEKLRLETSSYGTGRIIGTRNWREATDEHYAAFLEGDTDEETRALPGLSATLVARDLKDKGYQALYGR